VEEAEPAVAEEEVVESAAEPAVAEEEVVESAAEPAVEEAEPAVAAAVASFISLALAAVEPAMTEA
jgi:hypothetical protein